MTTWYTSDPHLGHEWVAEMRGFATTDEHDSAFISKWNEQVRAEDVVYILGDLAVSYPRYALSVISALRGRKHLVMGNHDPVHPMHRQAHKHEPAYREVFEAMSPFYRRRIAGQEVLLSHFPYDRDRGPARYTQYRLRDEGRWLVHGHVHSPERQVGREIHVGWDAWGRLVDQVEIAAMIEQSR